MKGSLSISVPVKVLVAQLCLNCCNPMDCSPPGSSAHGILQARILEWVTIPSCRGSSRPRDQTWVSYISCIGRQVLYHWHHLGSSVFVQDASVLPMAPALQHPPPLWPTQPFLSSDFLPVPGCFLLFLLHFCIMYTRPDLC